LSGEMGYYYTKKTFESARMVLIVLYCSWLWTKEAELCAGIGMMPFRAFVLELKQQSDYWIAHVQLKRLDNYLKTSTASEYLEEKAHARNYRRQLAALVC
jgi:hypothetical protein